MATVDAILYVFVSPFIFRAQDIYMILLASTIISLSISHNQRKPPCAIRRREILGH
jgi:hypothetical protein